MTASRRARAAGGRPRSVRVSFSVEEHGLVEAAAARQGLAAASWVGQVAVADAEASAHSAAHSAGDGTGVGGVRGAVPSWGSALRDLMMLRAELAEARRVLTNVGGNLNDVARHANSTGEIAAETGRVLGLVARLVGRVEDAVGEVDALAALARRDRLRSGSETAAVGVRRAGTDAAAGGAAAGSGAGVGGPVGVPGEGSSRS